ncbi:hypothetical protein [Achromobacter sp. 2789STDY5608615]|uniref:hypothetical protein n=1 Tax=Achromobacter sp. 2789STDY5608615 TaxID=1806492 RepID=UPI001E4F67FC|nr:hypothetical protein [Achromobacter sp. 2789STDY5608615]
MLGHDRLRRHVRPARRGGLAQRQLALRRLDRRRHLAVADAGAIATVRAGQQSVDTHRRAFDMADGDDGRMRETRAQLADRDVQVPGQAQVHLDFSRVTRRRRLLERDGIQDETDLLERIGDALLGEFVIENEDNARPIHDD